MPISLIVWVLQLVPDTCFIARAYHISTEDALINGTEYSQLKIIHKGI
jgi:hypothetical protein